jgi:hypothetical protein
MPHVRCTAGVATGVRRQVQKWLSTYDGSLRLTTAACTRDPSTFRQVRPVDAGPGPSHICPGCSAQHANIQCDACSVASLRAPRACALCGWQAFDLSIKLAANAGGRNREMGSAIAPPVRSAPTLRLLWQPLRPNACTSVTVQGGLDGAVKQEDNSCRRLCDGSCCIM